MICKECNHAEALHCGPEGECVVRLLQSGFKDFASLPQCGCRAVVHLTSEETKQ